MVYEYKLLVSKLLVKFFFQQFESARHLKVKSEADKEVSDSLF